MKQLLPLFIALLTLGATTSWAQQPTATPDPAADPAAPRIAGQISISDPTRLSAQDYSNLHLPPLHVLMENARERSPQVNMFDANKREQERELKTVRRSWLKYFKLNSTFSYGSTDINSELYYDNKYPVVQNVSGTTQRWWNVGASVSFPLEEIFNRRNRNKQQKERIESIEYEREKWYDEVCMKIIESYSTALENLAILESAAQAMVIAKAQYSSAELDFVNGQIDDATLSRQKTIENASIREYEQTRSRLIKALLELEVLSKTPIISK